MTLSAMIGLEDTVIDGMITLAGSVVHVNDEMIYENKIEKSLLIEMIRLFKENHIDYSLETRVGNFHTKGLQEFYLKWIDEHYKDPIAIKALKADKIGDNQYLIDSFDIEKINVQKVTFIAKKRKNFKKVQPILEKIFNIHYFSKNEKYIDGELILKDCTKVEGIKKVINYYNSPKENTIAFGDSMNDMQMLKYVHTAIARVDAPKELKQLAHYYFEDPDEDGIYKALLQMKLI